MANYCTWCGAELEPDVRFCPNCGARAPQVVTVDGTSDGDVDEMVGLDIVAGERVPAENTAPLDPALISDKVVVSTGEAVTYSLKGAPKKHTTAIVATITAAILILGGLGVWYASDYELPEISLPSFSFGTSSESSAAEAERGASTSDGSSAAAQSASASSQDASGSASSGQTVLEGDDAYDALSSAYGDLTDYNDQVASCVDDFNRYYVSSNKTNRQNAYDTANALLTELQSRQADLQALQFADGSGYASQRDSIAELYGYEAGRVQTLIDAWQVSLKYDMPSEHESEILAVLSESYSRGTNTDLENYNELYPNARPVKE